MKNKLKIFAIFAMMFLASCTHKNIYRGIIKEKFITSQRYGSPSFYVVTHNDVYEVKGSIYAKKQIGDKFYENYIEFNF